MRGILDGTVLGRKVGRVAHDPPAGEQREAAYVNCISPDPEDMVDALQNRGDKT